MIEHNSVKNEQTCFRAIFSDFSTWRGQMEKKFSKRFKTKSVVKQKLARFDAMFNKQAFEQFKHTLNCYTFEYEVDEHWVKGFLIQPKNIEKNLPVLIYNRGGNGNYGGVVFGSMMHNLFPIASEGFVIIGSQYRGTHTRTDVLDEFGGADVRDVLALLEIIPAIESADANRIGMWGASRGGMQTHLTVKQASNIKAIATVAGNTDLQKGLTYRPEMEKVYQKRIPNYFENKQAELEKRSVLIWVDKLSPNIPILLLHGTNDMRVSVNHSIDFAAALSKHDIPHKLVLYPNDNHGLTENKNKANREIIDWFKTYL